MTWQARKQRVWISPEQGLLAGRITTMISDQKIQIEDLQGNYWEVNIVDTIWRGRLKPAKDLKIKILGHTKGESRFVANEIRPWRGQGQETRGSKRRGGHEKNPLKPK